MKAFSILVLIILLANLFCVAQHAGKKIKVPTDTAALTKLVKESFNAWNSDPQRGLALGEVALNAAISLKQKKSEMLAYKALGVCYWAQANYSAALDANFKGIKLAEELNDNNILLALEHNLALIFGDLGDIDQAIYHLKRYIDSKIESKKFADLTGAYNNLGYYFSKKNLIDSSLFYYKIGLKISEGKSDINDECYLYASLSEAYFAKNDLVNAYNYNAKALALYSAINETIGILESHTMFGRIEVANKNYSLAKQHLAKAHQMVNQGHFVYHYIPIYQLLSAIDSAQGNHKQALVYFKKATQIKDSVNTIKQKQTFDRLLAQYRSDQKEKENLQLKKSNELIKQDAQSKRLLLLFTLITSFLIIGVILFYFINKTTFTKKIQQILIQQQVEKEKVRIAKELHDNIGSQLSVISLDLTHYAKQNLLSAPLYLQLNDSIHSTIDELRDTIWAMNKEEIEVTQLLEKISNLCWRFRKSTDQFQITVSENLNGKKVVLKPNQGLNIFRIVQESVSNSIRHSKGNLINIIIGLNHDRLIMEVHDNGKGFDKQVSVPGDHIGLINMRTRAEDIGANLIIDPLSSGTSIILVVPIQA